MSRMSTPQILVSAGGRTDEHAKVDSEIQHCLSEGWDAELWLQNSMLKISYFALSSILNVEPRSSLRNFSNFLYSEVQLGFLVDRVQHHLKKQREIDYSGEDH